MEDENVPGILTLLSCYSLIILDYLPPVFLLCEVIKHLYGLGHCQSDCLLLVAKYVLNYISVSRDRTTFLLTRIATL